MLPLTVSPNTEKISLLSVLNVRQKLVILLTATGPVLKYKNTGMISEIQKVLKKRLDLNPVSLLLGLSNDRVTDMYPKKLYNVLTFCARKNILMHWITDKAPSLSEWHRTIMEYIPLDFLTCLLHSKTNAFERTWKPFLDYVNVNVSAILTRAFV